MLLDTLKQFKVEGAIGGRTTGPVVTQFEVVPAAGVKVGRIAALADDLALTMRAQSIRIVAPIPGKGAVGVEVPNPTPRLVGFRELLEAPEWQKAVQRLLLPVALGRDLEGRPIIADLTKMPHLLIAGATGSGKSVCINTLITSLVYRYTPAELRFLMIDPKMVELSMYNALPHLRHRVVTDNKDAAHVLKWAVWEMQDRYELLHANNARNLVDFNHKLAEDPTKIVKPNGEAYEEGALPYILLFVDELADLIMTVQAEVETPLALLAQKARAIGIHLILATQRPVGERHHRPHQGELPLPDRLPRGVEDRQPHHPRPERRRGAARQRRHALHAAGEERPDAAAGRVRRHRRDREADALVRRAARGAARGGGRGRGGGAEGAEARAARPTSSRSCARGSRRRRAGTRAERRAAAPRSATRCSARRRRCASRTSSARRRSSSGGSRSATAARRGSSTSCTMRASSGRRTAPRRATCWSGLADLGSVLRDLGCGVEVTAYRLHLPPALIRSASRWFDVAPRFPASTLVAMLKSDPTSWKDPRHRLASRPSTWPPRRCACRATRSSSSASGTGTTTWTWWRRRGRVVVFVEVKSRSSDAFGAPSEAVTARKQADVVRAASVWLSRHATAWDAVRFDVITVRDGKLEWLQDAFGRVALTRASAYIRVAWTRGVGG